MRSLSGQKIHAGPGAIAASVVVATVVSLAALWRLLLALQAWRTAPEAQAVRVPMEAFCWGALMAGAGWLACRSWRHRARITAEDLCRRGVIALRDGDLDAATRLFAAAATACPGLWQPHYYRGVVASRQGRFAAARDHFELGLQQSPAEAALRFGLAAAFEELGDRARARPVLESLVAEAPDHAAAWCLLGCLHEHDGEPGLAIEHYQRALRANPTAREARENLERLERAMGERDSPCVNQGIR